MPESKETRRPTEAAARLALRERILELQAGNTPMSGAEKAKVAQRDQVVLMSAASRTTSVS